MRFEPRFPGWKKKRRERNLETVSRREKRGREIPIYASRLGNGCAWECVRVLDCASKAYFSPTSDIATASSCLFVTGCAIPSSPSSSRHLFPRRRRGMEDVFFGDACPFRERKRKRLSVVALNRVSLLFPSPSHRRMHATSADGGIYIMRARKTAIRPTELRLYRGRVCACLSRDQLPPRNIRWDPRAS